MGQGMTKPFSRTSTVLDVVHQVVISPLNAGDYVLQLQKPVELDPSRILVLFHAGTYGRGYRG